MVDASQGPLWYANQLGMYLPALILQEGLAGDANLDGKVDINDLTIVLTSYNQSTGANVEFGRLQRRRQGGHRRLDHCAVEL